nr:reverse transcriptase domain-containing protein [Tanacetum cinerariifolium]
MFLGYKVNAKGLKVCPDKVDAVLSLPSPKCLKDVQKLNEKLASLNRFLVKSAEKSLSFFKTLKKCTKSDFHWTTKAKEAFKQMKKLIAELHMLTVPMEKEELIVYLAAAKETVSAVLMTKREAKQMPIYFFSRALRGLERNYTSMEKLVLALGHASKRLKRPRVSVKGHILGDFIVERPEEDSPDTPMEEAGELLEPWILFTDGSSSDMICYLEKVKALAGSFKAVSIKQIPRSENKKADSLSKIAFTSFAHLSKQVLVEELKEKSISEIEILAVVEEEGDAWMTPLFKYLAGGTLPADANYALREIHEGSCSMLIGYYWPTMHKDARTLIRARQDCQVHKPVPRNSQQKLTPITSPWPFYKWGIDIAGPFPKGPGKVKFLIVAMDYVTKWIEAKPVATITGNQIKKFMWDNIVYRFGLPGEIISDNGKYNRDTPFSLTYGTEAVIPAKIGMPTLIIAEVDLVGNNEALEINLDLLEERKDEAVIREVKRKLGPKWEGPYEVTKALGKGSYKLRDRDGKQLPRTWNISNLMKCHIHKM